MVFFSHCFIWYGFKCNGKFSFCICSSIAICYFHCLTTTFWVVASVIAPPYWVAHFSYHSVRNFCSINIITSIGFSCTCYFYAVIYSIRAFGLFYFCQKLWSLVFFHTYILRGVGNRILYIKISIEQTFRYFKTAVVRPIAVSSK